MSGIGLPDGTDGTILGSPTILGTKEGKNSGIWTTHWDRWDCPGVSQLSMGHRMGRTVGLGHPLVEMGQSWDVTAIRGT